MTELIAVVISTVQRLVARLDAYVFVFMVFNRTADLLTAMSTTCLCLVALLATVVWSRLSALMARYLSDRPCTPALLSDLNLTRRTRPVVAGMRATVLLTAKHLATNSVADGNVI